MTGTITKDELIELIQREKILPEQLYTKEEILGDPKVKAKVEALIEIEKKEIAKMKKEEENDMIPGGPDKPLTDEEKKKQDEDNEFVADGKGESGDEDLIPD